jgi:hypothetical protein
MNALKNTLLAQAQNAREASAREAMEYSHDIAETVRANASKRKADIKAGQKNAQSNAGTKKGATTRVKAGNVNIAELLTKPMTRAKDSDSIQSACDAIKTAHESLVSGQIAQLDAFIIQGHALVTIKAKLVKDAETEKQADRAFGNALKIAGIGSDIIPRDARSMYVWLADNEKAVREFVNNALCAGDNATKEQKAIARKYKAVKLSPYIIKSAMTPKAETAERTSADTAKAHLKQVIAELSKGNDSDALTPEAVLKEAVRVLKAELNSLDF